ncbi:MAG: glycoside hydrolase [Acidobacteriota bacterium]
MPLRVLLLFVSALLTTVISALAQPYPPDLFDSMHWRLIGPFRGGRTRALAGVAGNPAILYIGVCNGGVWRSDDYGRTWTPIFDDQPTQSIGAIAVAPSDANILYVASGEGLQRPDLSVGNGIYRSADAGKTWAHLGLRDGQQIPSLAVDPRNANRIFAAVLGHPYGANVERGIFRSIDGGTNWEKVLYIDENTGGNDVDIDPSNPDVVYASFWQGRQGPWEYGNGYGGEKGGIFKSTDGGTSWHQLGGGLPDHIVEANLSIAPSDPKRLYVVLATTTSSGYESGKGQAIYRSDDAGATWTSVTDDPRPLMRIGGGDLPMLGVDPKNPDVIYSTSIVTVRSTDGGKTWFSLRGAPGGDDYQNVWIDPTDSNTIMLASDQGAVVSTNSGRTWSSWYNQPTAQLYHVQTSSDFPYRVCAGQQESGSVCISSRGNDGAITYREWHPVAAIEYGYVVPDPLDPDIIYGAGRNDVSKYHWSTGQVQDITPIPRVGDTYRIDRTMPLMFSPIDPHMLFYAANIVFRTTDGGMTWTTISPDLARKQPGIPASLGALATNDEKATTKRGSVYALGPSFKSTDTLWAGTDDGLIQRTGDGGKSWTDVTPPEMTPWSKVTQIVASHFDEDTAYASVSRLRIDDLRPYIYRTHDRGTTWQIITNGLPPDAPVNTVREDPVRQGLLFAGTETSVFVSFDDGEHWQSLSLNLPHSSVRDLWIHDNDLIAGTHGRSIWILDDLSPLRQLSSAIRTEVVHLFTPATAIRVRRDLYSDTPLPADEPMGANPPAGAIIDYSLLQAAGSPVTLEILDSTGKLVRRYASTDTPELTAEELAKQMIPLYWVRSPQILSAGAGMHRWVWDLRYAAPEASSRSYPISAVPHDTPRVPEGPLVNPGNYTVRLKGNGTTLTATLVVAMDPRVRVAPEALQQQLDLEQKLAALMTDTARAANAALSIREQVKSISATGKGKIITDLTQFDGKAEGFLEGTKKTDKTEATVGLSALQSDLEGLYDALGKVDAAPTAAQISAVAHLETDLRPLLGQWKELERELKLLNPRLRSQKLPELHPEWKPKGHGLNTNEE